jgi:hypothetical protein
VPRAKRNRDGKREFKYADTFDLHPALMPVQDPSLPRGERRRAQRALGFHNYIKRTKGVRRFLPLEAILTKLSGLEMAILLFICHVSIYRDQRFHGVCVSIRDIVGYVKDCKSIGKVHDAVTRLIALNLLVVLERNKGGRARVLMPNPGGGAWTPPPLCSEQKPHGNSCSSQARTERTGDDSVVFQPDGTEGDPSPIKRKSSEEKKDPPPPAQKGRGGAEEAPPVEDTVPIEEIFAAAKNFCKPPVTQKNEQTQRPVYRQGLGSDFAARCAAAQHDPAVLAAQRRLEEAQRARGVH